jgi:uncharacterized membrane protein (UPF0127 family)
MAVRSWSVVLAAVLALTACTGSSDDGAPTTTRAAAVTDATSAPTGPATTAPATTGPHTAPPVTGATTATTVATPAGVAPDGFATVAARVTAADGATCDVCLWLADTAERRAQGLMGVTDLSGADGMVFRWDAPTAGAFWMRDTPLPLSIAFFDQDGAFVSALDMTPCLAPTPDAECARYAAAGPYQFAVEVAAGGLPALLMAPGSRLELLAAACATAS